MEYFQILRLLCFLFQSPDQIGDTIVAQAVPFLALYCFLCLLTVPRLCHTLEHLINKDTKTRSANQVRHLSIADLDSEAFECMAVAMDDSSYGLNFDLGKKIIIHHYS